MNESTLVIVIHQLAFQGMFMAKNIRLHRKLRVRIRGSNPEAKLSIGFFFLLIAGSFLLSLFDTPTGTVELFAGSAALAIALALLLLNLIIGAASLTGLGDSWRVGVLEDQHTDLVESGIYRYSRNPYFLSYLVMFAAYTILLQNLIVLALSLAAFAMVHAMVLREEKHLDALHGETYRQYRQRVPRYLFL